MRLKVGTSLACLAALGVFLFGLALPAAARTTRITGNTVGGITPCVGGSTSPLHFASGTVVALRGSVTEQTIAPGESKNVFPRTEVAVQTVGENRQYRFVLLPGR